MAGFVGTMLNLFPMITVDPEGKACGFGRPGSERSNRKKMLDEFKRLTDRHGLWKYSVLHADAPGAAEELAADLEEACGRAPEYTMEISPVVGINTGPGSAGFALILED
jgi:fatty acid-binding protein DegV